MNVEPIYDRFPFKTPQVDQWNERHDNPEYKIELEAVGGPEDAFLKPLYDKHSVNLYADGDRISYIPVKPVDYTSILNDHVRLDQRLHEATDFQLVTELTGEWRGDEVADTVDALSNGDVDVQAFLYGTDCRLNYNESNQRFEVIDFSDQEIKDLVKSILEDF